MRSMVFAKRTAKEILRDPLSYIFCLGFPILMLVIMTIVNKSIPAQADMDLFEIEKLAPGMAYFGLSFIMIFTATELAGDRSGALLMRLHASPMKSHDFIVGYTLPMIVISVAQIMVTYAAVLVISVIAGIEISPVSLLASVPVLIPSAVLFIAVGLLFGTVFSEKTAPGACSIIVTVSGMLGAVWMPVDSMGGAILSAAKALPFYHGVRAARLAVSGNYKEMITPLVISICAAAGICLLAVPVMNRRLKRDIR